MVAVLRWFDGTRVARGLLGTLLPLFAIACGKPPPPTPSNTVVVPFQLTTYYALEQTGGGDLTARARYYDALQAFDWTGNAGTIALSPGDAAFADGRQLDIETRTEFLGTLRVDYSQTVPRGKTRYAFELRRPKESIFADVPAPPPFTLQALDRGSAGVTISWGPVVMGATVSIQLGTEDRGCLLLEGQLASPRPDTGSYDWYGTQTYRSSEHDCTFVITLERRTRTTEPARWRQGSLELPANGVHAETIRKDSLRLTLPKK